MQSHNSIRGSRLKAWVQIKGGAAECLSQAGLERGSRAFLSRQSILSQAQGGIGHESALKWERLFAPLGMQPGYLTNDLLLDQSGAQTSLQERIEMALKARLQTAAPNEDISQAGLSRFCGVTGPSVNGWFTGKTKTLKGTSLVRAALYLKVNAEWLSTGIGQATPLNTAHHEQHHSTTTSLPASQQQGCGTAIFVALSRLEEIINDSLPAHRAAFAAMLSSWANQELSTPDVAAMFYQLHQASKLVTSFSPQQSA